MSTQSQPRIAYPTDVADWSNVTELSRSLKLSRNSIYALVASGKLAAHRLGPGGGRLRFNPDDVQVYLNSTRTRPPAVPVSTKPRELKYKGNHGL